MARAAETAYGKLWRRSGEGWHGVNAAAMAPLSGAPERAYADGPVVLMGVRADAFLAVLADTPRLGANLARLLATRLRRTFTLFQDASFETVEVRLARQVLYLAERAGRRTERGIRLVGQLRQPDLADLLGATVRSVITVLNAWRASGWVSYDGDKAMLVVLDAAKLRQLVAPEIPGARRFRVRQDR